MRNTFSLLLILLTGCAAPLASRNGASSDGIKRNEACLESSQIKILQAMDDAILAHLCPTDYPSYFSDAFEACSLKGDLVYMSVKPSANDYVDDQKVTLPKDKCFVADGTHSYASAGQGNKRVRKIKIIDSQSKPNEAADKKK